VPAGFFLPVTPGTKFVTIGGAVANDVHGKSHHVSGCFGSHVISLEVHRSDGQRYTCSARENPELFAATVGGLGLTGIITRVDLQLLPISSPWLDVEIVRFENLSITTCANFSRVLISTSCPDASDKWTDRPVC